MLHILIGRAGAGKTAKIMDDIRLAVRDGRGGQILLVPEQYSYEAERELCRTAGDSLSRYAEVLSFTGLARRVAEETGTAGRRTLDPGGRLLCLSLALDSLGPGLRFYRGAQRSPELKKLLLDTIDELKSAMVSPAALEKAAGESGGSLSDKLEDLAVIMEAFDSVIERSGINPADRLSILAESLGQSAFGREGHIYVDGFTDFTAQELNVLFALMGRGAALTVCLNCDGLYKDSEVFELSRRTARRLIAEAERKNVKVRIKTLPGGETRFSDYLAENLFCYDAPPYGAGADITLKTASGVTAECEYAAARAIAFVREEGFRWRDIAVAVRGFEDYRATLEAAFDYYGVPLFTAKKTEIPAKPLPALIRLAYDIITGGWEPEDVFAYLRTGFTGLTAEACDLLENYCVTWNIRAPLWLSEHDWRLHPGGYGRVFDEAAERRLAEINRLRGLVAAPLIRLSRRAKGAATASAHAAALADFFDELDLAGRLALRAEALAANGLPLLAAEYEQLWEACCKALEQFHAVLGDSPMDAEEFSRLFLLTLSTSELGTVPVSLDMVSAGDIDRMRRRDIKHLILLGAEQERLPAPAAEGGVFSAEEMRLLHELGIELDAGDAELWREFTLIYNCLSLPSLSLTVTMPAADGDGAPLRPSLVMTRAAALFGKTVQPVDERLVKTAAPAPALELAAGTLRGAGDGPAQAAARYFGAREPQKLAALDRAAREARGNLSEKAVEALYGAKLRLSASRADKFASCRFSYFMQYGLRARPRVPAEFSPPEYGSFIHYILEKVAAEVSERGGFKAVADDELDAMTDRHIARYIDEVMNGFEGKSARFSYLFRRLEAGVRRIVRDMAEELRCSDFTPLAFEFDFGGAASVPLGDGGALALSGKVDRIDGWVHDGRLYLRVVDYKTGRKSFSLSDVLHGIGLQMLIYLGVLGKEGGALFGQETVPAGVLYVPVRDNILSAGANLDDEALQKERQKSLRRSGLLLDDAEVLHAMEHGESPVRLPLRWKDGAPSGDALASAERLGLLGRHVDGLLGAMAKDLRAGSIAADPFYKSENDNACRWCDYAAACRFADGEGGEGRRYIPGLRAAEAWAAIERAASGG